jgi:hypothetical protein
MPWLTVSNDPLPLLPPARQAVFNWVNLARAQLGMLTDIEYDFSITDVQAAVSGAKRAAAQAAVGFTDPASGKLPSVAGEQMAGPPHQRGPGKGPR